MVVVDDAKENSLVSDEMVFRIGMKNKKLQNPDGKISEAFLDFSLPLIDTMGSGATQEQIEKVLQITYTVWNSVVIDKVKGNSRHVSALRKTLKDDPVSSALIEQLISRKIDAFANDLRIIGEYKIVQKRRGNWCLRADARDPSEFREEGTGENTLPRDPVGIHSPKRLSKGHFTSCYRMPFLTSVPWLSKKRLSNILTVQKWTGFSTTLFRQ